MSKELSSTALRIKDAIVKYFNLEIWEILQSVNTNKYIIAGGFIHDVLNDAEPNDMDIFILCRDEFGRLIEKLTTKMNCELKFYKSIVEVSHSSFSKTIQLINSRRKDPWEIMDDFDFDYNRAFLHQNIVFAGINCLQCWETKKIDNPYGYNTYITKLRFSKALEKGYTFTPRFIKLVFNCDLDEYEITPAKIMELVDSNDDIPTTRKLNETDIILATSDTDLALKTFEEITSKNILNMTLRL